MCAALTTCTRSRREARASLAASSGTWRWVRCCCTPQLGLEMFESLQTSLLWTTFWRPVSIRSLAKWIIFCHVKRIKSRDFFEKIIKLKHFFFKLSAMKKKVVWKLWKHSHESAILRLAVCVSDITNKTFRNVCILHYMPTFFLFLTGQEQTDAAASWRSPVWSSKVLCCINICRATPTLGLG